MLKSVILPPKNEMDEHGDKSETLALPLSPILSLSLSRSLFKKAKPNK